MTDARSDSAARPGRPHRMPYDDSPTTATSVNVDARIGWLLRTSRLYAADLSLRRTETFLAALAAHGRRAGRSQLTRWEQGAVPAPSSVIDAYGRVLGLPDSALRAFADGIRQSGIGRTRAQPDPAYRPDRAELQGLLDRSLAGELDPAGWFRLAEDLNQFDTVFVSADWWEAITHRLVRTVCRSVGESYVILHRSLIRIGRVDGAAPHLIRVIEELCRDPHAQVVVDPVGSLEHLGDTRADALLVSMLQEPTSTRELAAAAWTAANRITSGQLTGAALAGLPALCAELADRADPDLAAGADLLVALPASLRAAALDRIPARHRSRLDELLADRRPEGSAQTTALAGAIASTAHAEVDQYPVDARNRMLEQLVHEGLFHTSSERRHQAWLTIELSPFRVPVASGLASLVQRGRHDRTTIGRAVTGLGYLAGSTHRTWLHGFIGRTDVPAELRAGAVRALAHLPPRDQDRAILTKVTVSADPAMQEAGLYALGMTALDAMEGLRGDPGLPPELRAAARWWSKLVV